MPTGSLRRSFHRGDGNRSNSGVGGSSGGYGGGGGGGTASLRGSTLGGFSRASRMRRSSHHFGNASLGGSAGFGAGSAGAASVDVAKASANYRPGFDPLALLRRLPPTIAGLASVRAGRGGIVGWVGAATATDTFWIELRGSVVVLCDPHGTAAAFAATSGNDVSEQEQQAAMQDLAGTTNPDDAVFISVFSVHATSVVRTPRGTSIRIRRKGSNQNVWLRFQSELAAAKWEQALVHAATERVACVSDFEFLAPIGKGASGKVFLVRDRKTGNKYALKAIPKQRVFESRSGFRHALDERFALQTVSGHPFFSQLRFAFQTRTNFYLVIDFYEGGDLYQYLRSHGGRLAEPQVRTVAAEVLTAMEHLHKCGFVYRDLKPENVLLDANGHVRLADFGLSKHLSPVNPLTATICGTHTYAAPEMLAVRHYGMSIDAWALGIFVYHIFRGRTPFEAKDLDQVIRKMNARQIRFPSSTSDELVGLIKRLLDWQPASRLGCGADGLAEIRSHPFFRSVDWDVVYKRHEHPNSLYAYEKVRAREKRSRDVTANSTQTAISTRGAKGAASAPAVEDGVATSAASGPCATTDANLSKSADVALSESAKANVAHDELRNFDLAEWADVSVDNDSDDPNYGDQGLWPMRLVRKRLEDDQLIVGFSFTMTS